MNLPTRHVLLPALGPLAIVGLYFTPVSLVGCANRGLAAFGVALLCGVIGVVAAVQSVRLSRIDRGASGWWALSAAILAVPAALLLGPLG